MKQLALLVLLCVLSTISINAQTLPECESIVQDFVHAINMHSSDGFDDSYYGSEFKYNVNGISVNLYLFLVKYVEV